MTELGKLEELARVTQGPQLQNSESLCNLLRFLVRMSFESPELTLKEYHIATEVFGRSADFDPRLDSTVRVQTSRLRSKITEYYAGPGADNPIRIEVPRGSYSAVFHRRSPHNHTASDTPFLVPAPIEKVHAPSLPAMLFPPGAAIWVAAALLLGGILGAAALTWLHASQPVSAEVVQPAVAAFWKTYKESPEPPVIVFNEAGTDTVGVGEAFSIHSLSSLFRNSSQGPQIKQIKNLAAEEWGKKNIVCLGVPESQSARSTDFRFQGELGIVNLKPAVGEPAVFLRSKDHPGSDDFALIEFRPGDANKPSTLMLAGTTTYGTQAAIEYLCTNESIEQLLFELNGNRSRKVVPFAAVLHVGLHDPPFEGSKIAALRHLN